MLTPLNKAHGIIRLNDFQRKQKTKTHNALFRWTSI